jgi:2,3,4,5-tetrahydropyridine-2-carboxylate N-succinyltransferase
MNSLKQTIEAAWENRALLKEKETQAAIRSIISFLDEGSLRVAEPKADGWQVNEWVKKAVVLYFPIQTMETIEVGPFEFHDKIPLKKDYKARGIRVVPHASGPLWRLCFQGNHFNAKLCKYRGLC